MEGLSIVPEILCPPNAKLEKKGKKKKNKVSIKSKLLQVF